MSIKPQNVVEDHVWRTGFISDFFSEIETNDNILTFVWCQKKTQRQNASKRHVKKQNRS